MRTTPRCRVLPSKLPGGLAVADLILSSSFCIAPDGEEVEVFLASDEHGHEDGAESSTGGQNCHVHAGVEHCTGANGESGPVSCAKVDRDYNVPLRIGLLFVMLVTSSIGNKLAVPFLTRV